MRTDPKVHDDAARKSGAVLGLSHIAMHVRDMDEAFRFWTTIFDAEPYVFGLQPESGRIDITPADQRATAIRVVDTVIQFSLAEGISGWDKEYPHYAFEVSSEQLVTLKERLDAAGVKTHPIWTRHGVEALMYFRDPSGNLFEFFCWQFDGVGGVEIDARNGGDFRPPLDDLRYEWQG